MINGNLLELGLKMKIELSEVFQNMLDDLEDEGLDSTYVLNYIGADGTKEFKKLIEQ